MCEFDWLVVSEDGKSCVEPTPTPSATPESTPTPTAMLPPTPTNTPMPTPTSIPTTTPEPTWIEVCKGWPRQGWYRDCYEYHRSRLGWFEAIDLHETNPAPAPLASLPVDERAYVRSAWDIAEKLGTALSLIDDSREFELSKYHPGRVRLSEELVDLFADIQELPPQPNGCDELAWYLWSLATTIEYAIHPGGIHQIRSLVREAAFETPEYLDCRTMKATEFRPGPTATPAPRVQLGSPTPTPAPPQPTATATPAPRYSADVPQDDYTSRLLIPYQYLYQALETLNANPRWIYGEAPVARDRAERDLMIAVNLFRAIEVAPVSCRTMHRYSLRLFSTIADYLDNKSIANFLAITDLLAEFPDITNDDPCSPFDE